MRPVTFALVSLLLLPCTLPSFTQVAPPETAPASLAMVSHQTAEWRDVARHLPDVVTAPPDVLETAADVLRARRYYADSMNYYQAALEGGGDPRPLLKKMGITYLELQQASLAQLMFRRALLLNKKDPVAWNDLGAAQFTMGEARGAIRAYRRAVKLEPTSAVFHSNLALAYFDAGKREQARLELSRAMQLDPDLLHRSGGNGYSAQILATTRYAEICFEMARIYAAQNDADMMLDWLTKASERGFDVRREMTHDAALRPMLDDARIQVLLRNSDSLRAANKPSGDVPSLGEAAPGR